MEGMSNLLFYFIVNFNLTCDIEFQCHFCFWFCVYHRSLAHHSVNTSMAMGDIVTRFKRVSWANILKVNTRRLTPAMKKKSSSWRTSVHHWYHLVMLLLHAWPMSFPGLNINYVMPIPGKPERQLLADVSTLWLHGTWKVNCAYGRVRRRENHSFECSFHADWYWSHHRK